MKISPPVPFPENKLIIGGNTKLRLLDVVEKKVFVLLKTGFNEIYINREVYVRSQFPYIPIPRILESAADDTWYCEEYIIGVPTNRLSDAYANKTLFQAVDCVHQMLIETKRDVILSEYGAALEYHINIGINQILYISEDVASDLKGIASRLVSCLDTYHDQCLTVAYCHGDFHQGNILAQEDKFWILDWEYSGEKQIGYDLMILLLGSRVAKGFSESFFKIVNDNFDDLQRGLIANWPELKWSDINRKKSHLVVFLLEDILFHISESKNKLFFEKADVLELRRDELNKIINNFI